MSLHNTARASLHCTISPHDTAMICTEFLKDLIAGGHLSQEMSFLACDPSKVERARRVAMAEAITEQDDKIIGLGYDGRKDKETRSMMTDLNGNIKLGKTTEEHVTLSLEPQGVYLDHFIPPVPLPGEKPALKQAQQIIRILTEHDSLGSLQVLMGDSTATNTGWKGGVHALTEKLLGRKVLWGICQLHTNELPPRHLIRLI